MATHNHPAPLDARIRALIESDAQFAAARPSPAVEDAVWSGERSFGERLRALFDGYAERPALGQRAVVYERSGAGRMKALRRGAMETLSYGALFESSRALARAWHLDPVQAGDRVCLLGVTGADYVRIDISLILMGAVAVPLSPGAQLPVLREIVEEARPTMIAVSAEDLALALTLAEGCASVKRVVVFDYLAGDDDRREALSDARARSAGAAFTVDILADEAARGSALANAPLPDPGGDALALLIYTSGSTGTPKGAMHSRDNIARHWRRDAGHWFGRSPASITLNFMPMSHVVGRVFLYGTLGNGGTAFFAADPDPSALLDDLPRVRPTELYFLPRVWDILYRHCQSAGGEAEPAMAQLRERGLGGRCVIAITGSAPISDALYAWASAMLRLPLQICYGSTEAGTVMMDGRLHPGIVTDWRLTDIPELGYSTRDAPYPRGELRVKTREMFLGYYRRPDVTAQVFDDEGFYKTGDIFALEGPGAFRYLDRRNNVLKLAQGEFVTLVRLETLFSSSPLVRQIFLYGNSARAYLLAVVVPADGVPDGDGPGRTQARILESLSAIASASGLNAWEVPRSLIIETVPFSVDNGLVASNGKLAWPKLKAHYGPALEQRYRDLDREQADGLSELRLRAEGRPVPEILRAAVAAVAGVSEESVRPDSRYADLGGDSLSALQFAGQLAGLFRVEVPVSEIISPAADMGTLAAFIARQREGGGERATFTRVHGGGSRAIRAADLTLDAFLDADTLRGAAGLPVARGPVRAVLLTGATGFLGRYLLLFWLRQMAGIGGQVVCLVRAKSDRRARARLDSAVGAADAQRLSEYRRLAAAHLRVYAGDKGEPGLGLPTPVWQALADEIDLIVDAAALVNHLLPYEALFGPNVCGTAELIRLALTRKLKAFRYVSTVAVGDGIAPEAFTEEADVRDISPVRELSDAYASGYGSSKWAGEVLSREASARYGLPAAVFRCTMILAEPGWQGQINLPDMFTRMIFSLAATGVAPPSFYALSSDGQPPRAHYDGLPVDFIAEAISRLGPRERGEFATYHVMNPHEDGLSLDTFTDWLIEAGCPIRRSRDYRTWLREFEAALGRLDAAAQQASALPLLDNYRQPKAPRAAASAPTERFRAAVRRERIGAGDIPHVSRESIVKYLTDLALLGLLPADAARS